MLNRARARRRGRALCEMLEGRRLLNAGDLDTSFSGDGRATVSIPGSNTLQAADVGVQSDGKVIVVGDCFGGALAGKMVVARYTSGGTLDTSFGGSGTGVASADFAGLNLGSVTTRAVAVQPVDDRIVVVGWAHVGGTISYFVIARFTAAGLLDPSFSGDGKDFISNFDELSLGTFGFDVAIQSDGKIVACGSSISNSSGADADMAVARYNSNGTLDSSFDGNGRKIIGFGDNETAHALTIDYNGTAASNSNYGRIMLVGDSYPNSDGNAKTFALARLNSSGSLDGGFSGDGKLLMPFAGGYTYSSASDVVFQPGGQIVVLGEVGAADFNTHNFGVVRMNSNGAIDTAFGTSGGRIEIDFVAGDRDVANALLIGQTGKLLVGGASSGKMVVGCLSSDGDLDTVFSGDGKLIASFGAISAQAAGMALAPGGMVVAAGAGDFATARFFDRKAITVSIGSLQPNASESGPSPAGFFVGRLERLSTPTPVYLNIAGTATPPIFFPFSNWDYSATNINFFGFNAPRNYIVVPANATFTGATITPVDDARVEGDETAMFSIAEDVTYDIGTPADTTLSIRDNDVAAGPTVTASEFVYNAGPPQRVRFTFNQSVATSIGAADFTVTGPGGAVPFGFAYDDITDTATLSFSGILPNGDYTARAIAAGITNSQGTPMASDAVLPFFFLGGDANHDRRVDVIDLGILATNWQELDMTFSQGDFNYDGVVDVIDLGILATNWQTSLPAPPLPAHLARSARGAAGPNRMLEAFGTGRS